MREMLCDFSRARGLSEVDSVVAQDQLDDGSTIRLAITIDRCGLQDSVCRGGCMGGLVEGVREGGWGGEGARGGVSVGAHMETQ